MQKELEEIIENELKVYHTNTWYNEDDLVNMFDGKIKTAEEELLIELGEFCYIIKHEMKGYFFHQWIENFHPEVTEKFNNLISKFKSLKEEQK